MSLHGPRLHSKTFESCWHIIILQAPGVKPIFKSSYRAAVLERASVPYSFQRRHLVVACSSPGLQGQTRICANGDRQNVGRLTMFRRDFESISGRQLVIRVQWRRVAYGALLALEHLLPPRRQGVESVRVRRRLERVEKEGQRV